MLQQPIQSTIDLGDGRVITLQTGRLARQADGAVTVSQGKCMIMATVCANREPKEGQDFFPLSVDYMEKFSSAGRIPGSFFKREGRLSDSEILISRLVDRALRPLFPEDYLCDVQVVITLISSDPEVMPDSLACLAASAAIAVSDIPIKEIISEVRVARVEGQYIVNPSRTELASADMDFMIGATDKNLMMVEGESKECSEEDFVRALEVGHATIRTQIKAQEELREKVGVSGKRDYPKPLQKDAVRDHVEAVAKDKILTIASSSSSKHARSEAFSALKKEVVASLGDAPAAEDVKLSKKYFEDLMWEVVRDMIVDDRKRLDGRRLDEVRSLNMEVDVLPSPHGVALFTRGETQSLTTVTFGTPLDELLVESAAKSDYTKFILHYNFPPYSTGEVKFLRGPGRREVGHGNLALRSLKQMMPGNEYAYTVRIVSDILESNGSSSMATVCAGSLALMDAGVPIPRHVGGVAMGLITRQDGKYAILTDILGDEDHLGDMDFKVTGTRQGICGIQMDIKIDGLSMDTMREALEQARKGRLHILDAMYECIPAHREEVKSHAPRMVKLFIDKEFIGAVIGPQGKIIQEIQRETGTTINIEEVGNQGEVSIFSPAKEGIEKAVAWIRGITSMPEEGEEYEATVKSIMPYGAFVEFLPGKQGLLHISEVSWKRLENLDGIMKEGDSVKVKLIGIDHKTGKFKLSRKALLPKPDFIKDGPRDSGRDFGREGGPRPPRREPNND